MNETDKEKRWSKRVLLIVEAIDIVAVNTVVIPNNEDYEGVTFPEFRIEQGEKIEDIVTQVASQFLGIEVNVDTITDFMGESLFIPWDEFDEHDSFRFSSKDENGIAYDGMQLSIMRVDPLTIPDTDRKVSLMSTTELIEMFKIDTRENAYKKINQFLIKCLEAIHYTYKTDGRE